MAKKCVNCKDLINTVKVTKTDPDDNYIGICRKTGRAVKDTLCGCSVEGGKIVLHNFNMTYTEHGIDWYVQHCGVIVDDYETEIDGRHVRQKIYRMDGKLYVETWYNGYRLLFHELFD